MKLIIKPLAQENICTVCKDKYDSINESYYCPSHPSTTAHDDCTSKCTLIGCNDVLISAIKITTAKKIKQKPQRIEVTREYKERLSGIEANLESALKIIYGKGEAAVGGYNIRKDHLYYHFTITSVCSKTYLSIHLPTPIIYDGEDFSTIDVWPWTKTQVYKRRFWRDKIKKIKTDEVESCMRAHMLSVGLGRIFSDAKFGYYSLNDRQLDTLEALCNLPEKIVMRPKTFFQKIFGR